MESVLLWRMALIVNISLRIISICRCTKYICARALFVCPFVCVCVCASAYFGSISHNNFIRDRVKKKTKTDYFLSLRASHGLLVSSTAWAFGCAFRHFVFPFYVFLKRKIVSNIAFDDVDCVDWWPAMLWHFVSLLCASSSVCCIKFLTLSDFPIESKIQFRALFRSLLFCMFCSQTTGANKWADVIKEWDSRYVLNKCQKRASV